MDGRKDGDEYLTIFWGGRPDILSALFLLQGSLPHRGKVRKSREEMK